jgi:hypothetical protein
VSDLLVSLTNQFFKILFMKRAGSRELGAGSQRSRELGARQRQESRKLPARCSLLHAFLILEYGERLTAFGFLLQVPTIAAELLRS